MLLPELEERDRLREVLQPVLAEPGELGVTVYERLRRGETTTWPPCPDAAMRAARCSSRPA